MKDRLTALVRRMFALNAELIRLKGWRDRQQLGPPAPGEAIEAIEHSFAVRLPPDYRAFLQMHNGWQQFEGQLDLLSTEQMCDPRILENLANIKGLAQAAGDAAAANGFVIQACATSADIAFLDYTGLEGERYPEVVRWEHEDIERYRSFSDYLEDCATVTEELVADERRRLR